MAVHAHIGARVQQGEAETHSHGGGACAGKQEKPADRRTYNPAVIRTKTALVLGAGASRPYRFPLGKQLKDEIVSSLAPTANRAELAELTGVATVNELERFFHSLRFSGLTSVDVFLESNPQFLDVGKFMIARTLIPFESVEELFVPFETPVSSSGHLPREVNWYEFLWGRMMEDADFDSFGENQLSIVTLNYDRSLEQYLYMSLLNAFGKSEDEAAEKVAQIPIVHVYGKLGNLPWDGEPSRAYEPDTSLEKVSLASEGIKILHETTGDSELFEEARRWLASSDRVVVLGFGFNQANVDRLGLGALTQSHNWASRKGIQDAELEGPKRSLASDNWTFVSHTYDCLDLLRRHIGWRW